jgi:hypothetical protein
MVSISGWMSYFAVFAGAARVVPRPRGCSASRRRSGRSRVPARATSLPSLARPCRQARERHGSECLRRALVSPVRSRRRPLPRACPPARPPRKPESRSRGGAVRGEGFLHARVSRRAPRDFLTCALSERRARRRGSTPKGDRRPGIGCGGEPTYAVSTSLAVVGRQNAYATVASSPRRARIRPAYT